MKERFMLKALGLLLIVFSADTVLKLLLGLFEGQLSFGADLLLLLIGIGLFYAHPIWYKAARLYVVLCGLALIFVAALAFAGFPDMGVGWSLAIPSNPSPLRL